MGLFPGHEGEASDFAWVRPLTAKAVYGDSAKPHRSQFYNHPSGGSKLKMKRRHSIESSQFGSSCLAKPVADKRDNCGSGLAGDALTNLVAVDYGACGLVSSRCMNLDQDGRQIWLVALSLTMLEKFVTVCRVTLALGLHEGSLLASMFSSKSFACFLQRVFSGTDTSCGIRSMAPSPS